jgi:putative Mg2+ transporter-C (MgtC) family protein
MQSPKILLEINLISITARLLLALICGGVLGIERGRKKRPAGFRTYMLVCMGATLVMITNQYLVSVYPGSDPARMGAQVISGIGFLGAGTIIVTGRNKVRGLTTAAGLWAAACVGLAIGIGFYAGAIIGCILTFIIMALLQNFDDRVMATTRILNLYIELSQLSDLGPLMKHAKENELKVSDLEINRTKSITETAIGVLVTIRSLKKATHVEVIETLSKADGVTYIEEI